MLNGELLNGNIEYKPTIIYEDTAGSNGTINFETKLVANKRTRIYYYYYNGNFKIYNNIDFIMPSAINISLETSFVESASKLIKAVRSIYITLATLVNAREHIITFTANGSTLSSVNPVDIYITRIEQYD